MKVNAASVILGAVLALALSAAVWLIVAGIGDDEPVDRGLVSASPPDEGKADASPPDEGELELSPTGPVSKDQTMLEVLLDDPRGRTDATAIAMLSLDRTSGEICYTITMDGLADPYDAHIHHGPPGADSHTV